EVLAGSRRRGRGASRWGGSRAYRRVRLGSRSGVGGIDGVVGEWGLGALCAQRQRFRILRRRLSATAAAFDRGLPPAAHVGLRAAADQEGGAAVLADDSEGVEEHGQNPRIREGRVAALER